jgi:hypothetical protein
VLYYLKVVWQPKKKKIGKVIHLYNQIGVAILELSQTLSAGDAIHFTGAKTDAKQIAASLQINHAAVPKAGKGDQVGLKLDKGVEVREGDEVYLSAE